MIQIYLKELSCLLKQVLKYYHRIIGFGIGDFNIIHVGGVFSRTEYLATGDPLVQAFSSEHCATEGG